MSTIKKITLFVILIILFRLPVFAQNKQPGYGFSVAPSFGAISGQAIEIVYKAYSDKLMSKLLWDLKPLFYAGLAADFGPVDDFSKHGFVGNLSFKMGIPQRTGTMEDMDWMYSYSDTLLTNYSRHNNFSERSILADVSLGWSFHISDFIAFGPDINFSYMHYYWIAKDGYYQYVDGDKNGPFPGQVWTDSIPKVPFSGPVCEYTQDWYVFSPGVFVKFRLSRFFILNGSFNYSPLIFGEDTDKHLGLGDIYNDDFSYGHYFKGGGGITFSPMSNLDITLSLLYSYITDSKGDIYKNSVKHPSQAAGGGYDALDIGLSVRLRLSGRR